MTREEIEKALLTGGAVHINSEDGESIILDTVRARQLAKIVFDHLRSSTTDNLSKDTTFFEKLETAHSNSSDQSDPDCEEKEGSQNTETTLDSRMWRIKKIETRGFGGLNAVYDDQFEFDVACKDYCIEGQNGSGKSSLANAVLFAMTGTLHRDQYGIWDNPSKSEAVVSEEGAELGEWPPIAVYPGSWDNNCPSVDVSVKLTFGNDLDDEEIEAKRRLYGLPGSLNEEVDIDPKLKAVPMLIEAGLLMPMRIQHIRVPEKDDNDHLVSLMRQLIGLEPLLDVSNLIGKLAHGNQRFLKFARENDADGKAQRVLSFLNDAQEKISGLETELDLSIQITAMQPISQEKLNDLALARKELGRRQAEGFQILSELAFEGFDASEPSHRQRVTDAIKQLNVDAIRQNEPTNVPLVLKGISDLAKNVEEERLVGLKSSLRKAAKDLAEAIKWGKRQKEDALFKLKATAAAHFEDCEDPRCPLCEQSLKGTEHRNLVAELVTLKSEAESAQTKLAHACRQIEQEVNQAAVSLVPERLLRVGRIAVKASIMDQVKTTFVEARHVTTALPGFAKTALDAISAAFEAVKEIEFGSDQSVSEGDDDITRVRRLLDHLEDVLRAAENWHQSRDSYRDAWAKLFSKSEEQSLTTRIIQLESTVQAAEPFKIASEKVEQAELIAVDYNKIVKGQALRVKIVEALKPLVKLRNLVNLTTRQTINEVSEIAKEFHSQIYNPEVLTYEETEISEFRGKQSLSFQAKIGNKGNWRIDASLLANVSWMRGILWSFLFAIRERAISRSGSCPFGLMVLDDPQMTFDTRNLRGWVKFLGASDGLKQRQPCQLLLTTHSKPFALEMMTMPEIRIAAIETGQPWSKPVQIVEGDFAAVRFGKMIEENSDDRARILISEIRVIAETLLKHAIERFAPDFVNSSEATLGAIIEFIVRRNAERQVPYDESVFGDLIAARSSYPDMFRQLSEPHHSVSEAITVREAREVYKFWQQTLFPAVRKVWEEYRFLQKIVVGEVAAIPLPANCNHNPLRSNVLAAVQPAILGRVAAYSDGRAASAIRIEVFDDLDMVELNSRAAYRLEKDTLSPVARVGDILLTRLDKKCRAQNLVVEDRGTHQVARRWLEYAAAPTLAVLAASSSNPREVPSAIISRAAGANRRKIVGVLFAAERLQPGGKVDSDVEVTELGSDDVVVADLIAGTDVFEVQGGSAEPIALDKQYLLAKRPTADLPKSISELDGKPVIVEDSEDCAFFKRLRILDETSVVLESLDKTGSEGLVPLSTDPVGQFPLLTRVREVVGVIFDKV